MSGPYRKPGRSGDPLPDRPFVEARPAAVRRPLGIDDRDPVQELARELSRRFRDIRPGLTIGIRTVEVQSLREPIDDRIHFRCLVCLHGTAEELPISTRVQSVAVPRLELLRVMAGPASMVLVIAGYVTSLIESTRAPYVALLDGCEDPAGWTEAVCPFTGAWVG